MGWAYPPNSIIGTIFLVPIEEHLFFILQPIFLILLHCLFSHSRLIPFEIKLPSLPIETKIKVAQKVDIDLARKELDGLIDSAVERTVQTLPRRPLDAFLWVVTCGFGVVLVNEAYGVVPGLLPGLQLGEKAFYLGLILVWISPVIGFLSWLGAKMGRDGWWAWAVGSAWLCMVDT